MSTGAMTQSLEDYLESIFLIGSGGCKVQVRDIALRLRVKMPSVVKAIREFTRLGLAEHRPYADVALTDKGRRVARLVLRRHELLRSFLMGLGVSDETADRDACLMEHILSAETIDRIRIHTQGRSPRLPAKDRFRKKKTR